MLNHTMPPNGNASGSERQQAEIDALRAQLDTQTVQMGYALECIRQLVNLAIEKGRKRDSATKTAQRFLADLGGAS